jgi:hypothetical protein
MVQESSEPGEDKLRKREPAHFKEDRMDAVSSDRKLPAIYS